MSRMDTDSGSDGQPATEDCQLNSITFKIDWYIASLAVSITGQDCMHCQPTFSSSLHVNGQNVTKHTWPSNKQDLTVVFLGISNLITRSPLAHAVTTQSRLQLRVVRVGLTNTLW